MVKNSLGLLLVLLVGVGCRKGDLSDGRYQGVVELERRDLGFDIAGRVAEVGVERGMEVQAGQVLARLDDGVETANRSVRAREAEAAQADVAVVRAPSRVEDVRSVEAQLAAAKATEATLQKQLDRERTLTARGALPAASMDDSEARLARATGERSALMERLRLLRAGSRKEEVARAEAHAATAAEAVALEDVRLDRHQLRAPVAGTVLDIYTESGEMAGAGAPVLSIVDRKRPYADVFVPEAGVSKVRVGAAAEIYRDGAAPLHGEVELVYPRAEFTPRYVFSPRERPNLMFRVRVRIQDPGLELHAGTPVFVAIAPGAPGVAGARPPVSAKPDGTAAAASPAAATAQPAAAAVPEPAAATPPVPAGGGR